MRRVFGLSVEPKEQKGKSPQFIPIVMPPRNPSKRPAKEVVVWNGSEAGDEFWATPGKSAKSLILLAPGLPRTTPLTYYPRPHHHPSSHIVYCQHGYIRAQHRGAA